LGKKARFVTSVPDNAIGEACIREVRKYGVDVDSINRIKGSRLGIYYLETGANQRASSVVYDRAGSAFATSKASDYPFDAIMADAAWFHVTGITPAVSQEAADAALAAMQAAKKHGATVSIDLNYRKKLWNYGKKAPEVMRELTKYADVVIANEEDIQKCLDIQAKVDVTSGKLDPKAYEALTAEVKKQFPNVNVVAVTLRESHSADHNGWSAALSASRTTLPHYNRDIIDGRSGDSFARNCLRFRVSRQINLNYAVALLPEARIDRPQPATRARRSAAGHDRASAR
jgi:2-dehydro-3-deoxygluconokinase